jgi:hypothetical protein
MLREWVSTVRSEMASRRAISLFASVLAELDVAEVEEGGGEHGRLADPTCERDAMAGSAGCRVQMHRERTESGRDRQLSGG